jgi:transposase
MPKAISLDLRQRILHALSLGQSQREVATRFAVSEASVKRYKRLHKETGALATRPRPGNRAARKLTDELRQIIIAWLDARPDLILSELAQRLLEQYDVSITPSQISRTIIGLGYSRKKTLRLTHADSAQTLTESV